jgi:hypothetical protein
MTAIENQSLFDIAIQEEGSVLAVFDWAIQNGLSITDELAPGQQLIPAGSQFKNFDVANYYKGKNQMIATASNNLEINAPEMGIGTMIIETNFTVA